MAIIADEIAFYYDDDQRDKYQGVEVFATGDIPYGEKYRILLEIDGKTHDLYFIYYENIKNDVDSILSYCYNEQEAIEQFEQNQQLLAHIVYPRVIERWELGL